MREPSPAEFDTVATLGGVAPDPAPSQGAANGTGVADARRAGEMPAAAATPWQERPFAFAPRPKVDPMLRPPECGWAEARRIQAKRRSASAAAKRLKPKRAREAGLGALIVSKSIEAAEADAARRACPVEQAAGILRRRGFVVVRMTVYGGSAKLWFASCLGKNVTDEQIIAEAERHRERLGK